MMPEEQIQRFFAKQCTAEEAEQVAAWLHAHPVEAAAYFEEAEWQKASAAEPVPDDVYVKTWQQIYKKIRIRKRSVLLKRSVVAACIAGCLAVGIFYVSQSHVSPSSASLHPVVSAAVTLTTVDTEYNVTNKPRRIAMSDGSVVSLSPKSTVWFDTPFAQTNTRDIYLQGEARFEVAKNKLKPFTVFSGSFSTTALGTEFIVKEQPHNISVQLMHGKVVIKNTDHSVKKWKNVYLLPGQQMTYNDTEALVRTSIINEQRALSAGKLKIRNITQRETADSLIFNGSPMATVLQKLRDYYHIEIRYSDNDIKNISFTGVIVKKDSVHTILKAITQMNGLSIENTDSSFIISREKN